MSIRYNINGLIVQMCTRKPIIIKKKITLLLLKNPKIYLKTDNQNKKFREKSLKSIYARDFVCFNTIVFTKNFF